MLRHLGGVGVFILAALDSSVLPTLGAVDAVTILLAARHPELWPYYPMCSTAGSLSGASLAYRLSGLGVLHGRIKGAAFDRVTAFLKRFGSLALSSPNCFPRHSRLPHSCFLLAQRAIASLRLCCHSAQDGRAALLYWLISRLCLAGDPWRGRGRPTRYYF